MFHRIFAWIIAAASRLIARHAVVTRDPARRIPTESDFTDDGVFVPDGFPAAIAHMGELNERRDTNTVRKLPAVYPRHHTAMVSVELSGYGVGGQGRPFTPLGVACVDNGFWETLGPVVDRMLEIGFQQMDFWHLTGMDRGRVGHTVSTVNGWYNPVHFGEPVWSDYASEPVAGFWSSFADFVQRCRSRGMGVGVYMGGFPAPRLGTNKDPRYEDLEERSIARLVREIAPLADMGITQIGFDAWTGAASVTSTYSPSATGERDSVHGGKVRKQFQLVPRLSEALRTALADRGVTLYVEPFGPWHLYPSLFIVRSARDTEGNSANRPCPADVPHRFHLDRIVSGAYAMPMLHGSAGWTRDEFDVALSEMRVKGHRPAAALRLMRKVGYDIGTSMQV